VCEEQKSKMLQVDNEMMVGAFDNSKLLLKSCLAPAMNPVSQLSLVQQLLAVKLCRRISQLIHLICHLKLGCHWQQLVVVHPPAGATFLTAVDFGLEGTKSPFPGKHLIAQSKCSSKLP